MVPRFLEQSPRWPTKASFMVTGALFPPSRWWGCELAAMRSIVLAVGVESVEGLSGELAA